MYRKVLIYILVLAAVMMVSAAFFLEAYDICKPFYTQRIPGNPENGEKVLAFTPVSEDMVLVAGRYTKGALAGELYYRVYDGNGRVFREDHFGLEDASLDLTQTFARGGRLYFICTVNPRGDEESVYGAVYTTDLSGKQPTPVFYRGENTDRLYDFDKFISIDDTGTYYAGIYGQRVLIFDQSGTVVLRLNPELTRQIAAVRYTGSSFLVAGCTSESGRKETIHRAFCAAYNMEGTKLWREYVMGEEGTLASVLHIVGNEAEGWTLYGRFAKNSKDASVSTAMQIEAFSIYGNGMEFQIEGNSDFASNAFLVKISQDGQATEQIAYSEIVPSLIPGSLYGTDGIMLQAYTAKHADADRYTVKLIRLNDRLRETLRVDIPVWGDMEFYCAPSGEAGRGLWVYNNGAVRHFRSEEATLRYYTDLRHWRPVCEAALSIEKGAPLLIGLYGIMSLCTLGTVRSPHSRQYGRGKRKV